MASGGELKRAYDQAAGNYARGLALWEQGKVSGRELGALKRRANRAAQNLASAHYADAALIAAAPDMLAALEEARFVLDGFGADPIVNQIDAALAKARGEQVSA